MSRPPGVGREVRDIREEVRTKKRDRDVARVGGWPTARAMWSYVMRDCSSRAREIVSAAVAADDVRGIALKWQRSASAPAAGLPQR